jgi:hypothetical protein
VNARADDLQSAVKVFDRSMLVLVKTCMWSSLMMESV